MPDDESTILVAYRLDPETLVSDHRAALAENPYSEWDQLQLAVALFMDDQLTESAKIASRIRQVEVAHVSAWEISRNQAQQVMIDALKRCRPLYEQRAREIPSEDGFAITMMQFDNMMVLFEEEMAKDDGPTRPEGS